MIGSLRTRVAAWRARREAGSAVAGLVAAPPPDLAGLERLTGPLDVDLDGAEGRGGGVFRPESPFAPRGTRRGRLRPGIVRVAASFAFDPYHGQPRDPRLLRPDWVSLSVDLDRAEVLRRLESAHGPARQIDHDGRDVQECGTWYYLEPWVRPATLAWHARQPDWAVPAPQAGAADALLAALASALRGGRDAAAVAAIVGPLAGGAGALVSGSGDVLTIMARPGLPVAAVVAAFGWEHPVAWSRDVHMSTWYAGEGGAGPGEPRVATAGGWVVELQLEGWPEGAPVIGPAGPAAQYDLRGRIARAAVLTARSAPADGAAAATGASPVAVPVPPAAAPPGGPPPGATPPLGDRPHPVQRGADGPLPWYYAVNDRPVKIVPLPDGGADALVLDWATGGFVPDRSYFARTMDVGIGKDVDAFTADEFARVVAALRRPIIERLVATPLAWERTGDGERPFRCRMGERTLEVRVNGFPADPPYSLLVEGDVIAALENWPAAWTRLDPAGR